MWKRCRALSLMVLLAASVSMAENIVLPTFACNLPGRSGSLWSSEVYLVNSGPEALRVTLGPVFSALPGGTHQCLPPQMPWDLPPYSSVTWFASAMWRDLGCPKAALGALILHGDRPFTVRSRLVSTSGLPVIREPLAGVSQEIPGIAVEDLPDSGTTYLLPGIGWPLDPCGQPAFTNYLRAVNPGPDPVTLTLQLDAQGTPGTINVEGRDVPAPYAVTLQPGSWRQLRVGPPVAPGTTVPCLPPQLHDLYFTVGGPAAVLVSVVDNRVQGPRTVMPVKLAP